MLDWVDSKFDPLGLLQILCYRNKLSDVLSIEQMQKRQDEIVSLLHLKWICSSYFLLIPWFLWLIIQYILQASGELKLLVFLYLPSSAIVFWWIAFRHPNAKQV